MPEPAIPAIAVAAGLDLLGVVLALEVGLDLARVPAHEAVAGLAELDLVLGLTWAETAVARVRRMPRAIAFSS